MNAELREAEIAELKRAAWFLARCRGAQAIPMSVIKEFDPERAAIEIERTAEGTYFITAHLGGENNG